MNREIKFRGKRIDDNAWVYGSLLIDYAGTFQIWQKDESGAQHNFIVDPNTLGQYSGLKDKNGKEIYENDILKYSPTFYIVKYGIYNTWSNYSNFVPRLSSPRFYLEGIKKGCWENVEKDITVELISENGFAFIYHNQDKDYDFNTYNKNFGLEIIGNIFDNPELLEGK